MSDETQKRIPNPHLFDVIEDADGKPITAYADITLRDLFALGAMIGDSLAACSAEFSAGFSDTDISRRSYALADAMLKERQKDPS